MHPRACATTSAAIGAATATGRQVLPQERICQAGPSSTPLRTSGNRPGSNLGVQHSQTRRSHSSSRSAASQAESRDPQSHHDHRFPERGRLDARLNQRYADLQRARTAVEDEMRALGSDVPARTGAGPLRLADLFPKDEPRVSLLELSRMLDDAFQRRQSQTRPAGWPFTTPKSADLYRDAYIARPDRFDWRQRRSSLLRSTLSSPPAKGPKAPKWPVQRRKPSAAMLQGEEGKMTEKAIRMRERALRKKGLTPREIETERRRLEARQEERMALRAEAGRYQERWSSILDFERAREMREIEERLKSPIEKLIEDGLAFDGLQAYWQDDSRRHFGKRTAVFKLSGAQELPRSHFKVGDKVTIIPSSGASSTSIDSTDSFADDQDDGSSLASPDPTAPGPQRIQAEIVDKQRTLLRLKFDEEDEKTDLIGGGPWRMDHGYNDLTYERMRAAMDAIGHDVEFVESRSGPNFQTMLSGTRLNDLILGVDAPGDRVTRGAFWEDARIQSWYDRYSRADPLVIDGDPDLGLNASQTRAIATMLKERISLVQGPPGTGKTRTIVQAIKLLKHEFQVPHPILLAAHTNVAVDNLAEGCLKAGLRVVRVGPSSRARSSIANSTLDAHFIRHPMKARLDEIKRMVDTLERQRGVQETDSKDTESAEQRDAVESAITSSSTAKQSRWDDLSEVSTDNARADSPEKQLVKLKRSYYFWRSTIRGQILNSADVICGSAIAAGSPELDMIDFPVVFFDEGSMATEPISLVPLMKGCRHLSIIGDHKQLPPVVTSAEAKEAGLSRSLFERLIENRNNRKPVSSTMLDVQFRMHPSIAEYPVKTFYDGALASGDTTHAIEAVESSFLPSSHPDPATGRDEVAARHLGFVDHTGRESKADNHSLQNRAEAQLLLEILVDLLVRNPKLRGRDIGIVTPYLGQQILLEKMLHVESSPARRRAAALLRSSGGGGGGSSRVNELGEVDIHTVDGFEGREKRVILFSTVRTNVAGYVGFLADGRRLNVALTRAQSCLLVVGSLQTLRGARLSDSAATTTTTTTTATTSMVESPNIAALRGYAEYVEKKGLVVDAQRTVRRLQVQRGEDVGVEEHGGR